MKTCNLIVLPLLTILAVIMCSPLTEAKDTKPEIVVVTINGEKITQAAIDAAQMRRN